MFYNINEFRDPQRVERSIDNVRNAIPQTTRY
jgi:hypothetical protein